MKAHRRGRTRHAHRRLDTCCTNGEFYRDPGADYYTRHDPAKTKARAVKQLEALGYHVTLQPLPQAG